MNDRKQKLRKPRRKLRMQVGRKETMNRRMLEKLTKREKEKWQKLAQHIHAQEMVIQEGFEDLSDEIMTFEKIPRQRRT